MNVTVNTTKNKAKNQPHSVLNITGMQDYPTKTITIPTQQQAGDVVEVGWNGRMFLTQRGRKVQVPLPLYHILHHAGLTGEEAPA